MRFINAIVACSVIAITSSSVLAQSTAVQWTTASGGNGHWYERVNLPSEITWTSSNAAANALNGHLVTLTSATEQSWVYQTLVVGQSGCFTASWAIERAAWIGLFQDTTDPAYSEPNGGWKWVTNEPLSYNNWHPGEPNNGSSENVAGMYVLYQGQWNDEPNDASLYCYSAYIIEWSADCNNDGIVDYGQILSGQLIDTNSNGIPDICEVDQCPGDISGNGAVDGVDLTLLLGVWGTDGIGGEFDADITNDGIVGGADLTVLFSGWGPCPPPILPWATVLEQNVNPAVVTDATLRNAITATGLPWRVRDNGTNIEMLLVPGGTFMMGCSTGDAECGSDERPAHQVTLTNAFYMGKTEVTQAQWLAVMGTTPSYFVGNPNNPVERVSWNMTQGFNTATGLRLPTEAEWEFACRARTTTARYGVLNDVSWYDGNAGTTTHAVATKLPNALGLYDTLGNVWEWCQDRFGVYPLESVIDPTGPTVGATRLFRGGCWRCFASNSRGSQRYVYPPSTVDHDIGFRAARNP